MLKPPVTSFSTTFDFKHTIGLNPWGFHLSYTPVIEPLQYKCITDFSLLLEGELNHNPGAPFLEVTHIKYH